MKFPEGSASALESIEDEPERNHIFREDSGGIFRQCDQGRRHRPSCRIVLRYGVKVKEIGGVIGCGVFHRISLTVAAGAPAGIGADDGKVEGGIKVELNGGNVRHHREITITSQTRAAVGSETPVIKTGQHNRITSVLTIKSSSRKNGSRRKIGREKIACRNKCASGGVSAGKGPSAGAVGGIVVGLNHCGIRDWKSKEDPSERSE